MSALRTLAVMFGIAVIPAGCCSTAKPDLARPGTADVQQKRALRYDPYPENEPAPPLAGLRPREYDVPPPEPSRARWTRGNWGQ